MWSHEENALLEQELGVTEEGWQDFLADHWIAIAVGLLFFGVGGYFWAFGFQRQPAMREFAFITADTESLAPGIPLVLGGIEVGQVTHAGGDRLGAGRLQLSAEIAERLPMDSRFVLGKASSPRVSGKIVDVLPGQQSPRLPDILRIVTNDELSAGDSFGLPIGLTPAAIWDSAQARHSSPSLGLLAIMMTCIGLLLAGLRWLRAIIIRLLILLLACCLVLIWLFYQPSIGLRFPKSPSASEGVVSAPTTNQESTSHE